MSKDLFIAKLMDAYGALLTKHSLDVLSSYYNDDLSLAEIAEQYGITRQAALNSIQRSETQLRGYEQKMGLVEKNETISGMLCELDREIDSNIDNAKSIVNKIIDLI